MESTPSAGLVVVAAAVEAVVLLLHAGGPTGMRTPNADCSSHSWPMIASGADAATAEEAGDVEGEEP